MRRLDEDVLLCVANVSRFAQPVELDLSAFEGYAPVEMLGYTEFPRVGKLPLLPHPRSLQLPLVRAAASCLSPFPAAAGLPFYNVLG